MTAHAVPESERTLSRRASGEREVRLVLPDARSARVREEIADEVRRFDPTAEADAMRWIEAVSLSVDDDGTDAPR